jgi:MFS family permease
VITQILSMIQALLLAGLVLTETIQVWQIITLSFLLGLINTLDQPTRQTFVTEMVEIKEDLGNAIALNSSMQTVARFIGPSLAGLLIAAVGEGVCFLINGLSFVPVIGSLLAMKITAVKTAKLRTPILRGLKEGCSYTFGFAPIRSILLFLTLISLMAMPYTILMPVIARDILHSGARTFGFLVTASGCGALVAALFLAARRNVKGLGKLIVVGAAVFGIGLILLSLSRTLWLSLLLMFVAGFGMVMSVTPSNTIIQTIVDEDKRGRVMSFYTMAFFGTMPIGSLLAGSLAHMMGAPATIMAGGITCLVGAAVFSVKLPALMRLIRPLYEKK